MSLYDRELAIHILKNNQVRSNIIMTTIYILVDLTEQILISLLLSFGMFCKLKLNKIRKSQPKSVSDMRICAAPFVFVVLAVAGLYSLVP